MTLFIAAKILILSAGLSTANVHQPVASTPTEIMSRFDSNPALLFKGLDPQHYLGRRRPEPNIDRELRNALSYAAEYMALYAANLEGYPFSAKSAYPSELSAETILALQGKERIALKTGIIRLAARSQHPAAFDFLQNIINKGSEEILMRATAARALAWTQQANAQALLLALMDNPREALPVRSAAVQALAHFKTPEVLGHFRKLMWSNNSPELTRALVPALATLGTAQPLNTGAALQEKASALLAEFLVSGHENTRHIQANLFAQAFSRVPHPNTIKILQEALKSNQTLAQKQRIRSALRHMELAQKRAQNR
tara:strand:- start:694 stop:1632 length:939 start_codon:yes stop_codon:yes gene_type:complete